LPAIVNKLFDIRIKKNIMMNNTQKTRQKLVDIDKIHDEIYGVNLSELDKERLSYGEYTSVKEHFTLPNGSVKDGKVKLSVNNKGEVEYHFLFQKEILEIPERIGGKKISKEQLEDLKAGKTVLLSLDEKDIYLKVDKELNCVSISTGKEIGIPDEIGGYKLTSDDKVKLANNEPIGSRIYQGKDGYFIANIKLSKDNKEMIFMDIKSVERPQDIKKYIETLNKKEIVKPKVNTIKENTQEDKIVQNIKNEKTIENAIDVAVTVNSSMAVNNDVIEAIKNKDFKTLNMLRKDGKINDAEVKYVREDKDLSTEDKSAVLTIIGEKENIEQQKKEFYKAVDEKNPDKIKELTNKGFILEQTELDYITNHKGLKPEEKREMLSSLNVSTEEKNKSEIKIGKIEEQLKAEKLKEAKEKDNHKEIGGKIEKAVGHAFNDM
jgi:hypothetical protein